MTETAASFAPVIWGNPGAPPTALTVVLSATWEFFLVPQDAYGNAIPTSGATAAMRVSDDGTDVVDLTGVATTNPNGLPGFLFSLTAAQQATAAITAGAPYAYEIQVTVTGLSLTTTQAIGPFYVQPSLFAG